MKYLPLGLCLFFVGCIIGPVEDLYEQVEDTYLSEHHTTNPTSLRDINPLVSVNVVWRDNVGDHNGDNFSLLAFDDFIGRKCYHIVLDYFEIIEKSKDNKSVGRIDHLVILKKKPNLNIPESIIKKYEFICD